MHNVVLSPISTGDLIDSISKKVTADLLQALKIGQDGGNNEQLLNISEAAKLLNLTVPTIYSKVSKGELPFMKRSKRLYFSKQELISYIKEGRKKTNAEIESEANLYLKK